MDPKSARNTDYDPDSQLRCDNNDDLSLSLYCNPDPNYSVSAL